MNLLLDKLPTSVIIDGKEYEFNTDFRAAIRFELLLFDTELSDEDKAWRAIELFYTEIPENIQEAFNRINWFYCGIQDLGEKSAVGKQEIGYSLATDSEYIYAAFLDQYGIDLQRINYMHWWTFKSLFKSLKDDCEFIKIIGYRTIKISDSMSKEEKEFYRKMKKRYTLPKYVSKSEKDKQKAIEEILLNGGDVQEFLKGSGED